MKYIFLFITFSIFRLGAFSQTNLSLAPDFEAVDINGDSWHLFNILDEGKYVYINFFRVNCTIDQENLGKTEAAFNFFGCNGGDVVFLGVNTGNNKTEVEDYVNANSINYPVISGISGAEVSTIFEDYNVAASPTFILIAPNDSIVEQNIWPVESSQIIIDVLEGHGLTETICTVGINELMNKNEAAWIFYPNPANAKIEFNLKLADFNNAAIRIQNLLGKEILYLRIGQNNPEIKIQDFQAGIYLISLLMDNQTISTKKLIIKH